MNAFSCNFDYYRAYHSIMNTVTSEQQTFIDGFIHACIQSVRLQNGLYMDSFLSDDFKWITAEGTRLDRMLFIHRSELRKADEQFHASFQPSSVFSKGAITVINGIWKERFVRDTQYTENEQWRTLVICSDNHGLQIAFGQETNIIS